jgi:hypothetical protein
VTLEVKETILAPIHAYMLRNDGSDARTAAIERLGILGDVGNPALTALVRIASHIAGGGAAAFGVDPGEALTVL